MERDKRKRSPNWLSSEKELLLDLVAEHFSIIENKKTDGSSMRQKLAEWNVISEEYNCQTTHIHRTADNLKAQWESMKKAAKKEASYNKLHLIHSGGGPAKPSNDNPLNNRIITLIKQNAVGFCKSFDNDQVVQVNIKNELVPAAFEQDSSLEDPMRTETPSLVSSNENLSMDYGDYTPQILTPVSEKLLIEIDQTHENKIASKKWNTKRKSLVPSSNFNDLREVKIQAIKLQMQHAIQERQEIGNKNIVELEILKEKLKQEKIKTRLLLKRKIIRKV